MHPEERIKIEGGTASLARGPEDSVQEETEEKDARSMRSGRGRPTVILMICVTKPATV